MRSFRVYGALSFWIVPMIIATSWGQDAATEQASRRQLAAAIVDGKVPIITVAAANMEKVNAINAALDSEVGSIEFNSVPLRKVITELAVKTKTTTWINVSELDLLGIDVDTPVSASFAKISLRSLLNLLLEPLELPYMVRNEVLEITTRDSADIEPVTEVYWLPAILAEEDAAKSERLVKTMVDPDVWLDNGGTSEAMVIAKKLLVVSAATSTHYRIRELLGKIQAKGAE